MIDVFNRLGRLTSRKRWLIFIGFSVLITEVLVGLMQILLRGQFTHELFLTGLAMSSLVAILLYYAVEGGIARTRYCEQIQKSAEYENQQSRLIALLETTPIGIFETDRDGKCIYVNKRWSEITGLPFELASEDGWANALHPDDKEKVYAEWMASAHEARIFRLEYRFLNPDGTITWVLGQSRGYRSESGELIGYIGSITDISEQKQLEIELKLQANIDFLTGVYSRRHFMEQADMALSHAIRYDRPLSLFMMDIDYFKRINDIHGHKAGDEVLCKLADICRLALREVDIIGRIGGEEFAILLPVTGNSQAHEVAERLRCMIAAAQGPISVAGLPIQFTVSIGVVTLSARANSIDVLLSAADMALYEAKNSGRNKICIVGDDCRNDS